ncbi:amidohydrolase [Oscillibacter sp. MSJ-2]|uniref:Peptidase M20 domain-containing protein 2 n=1 Tax=Dysosmobacter acutus TaxID=2841504 RepID=A0ABS6F840_9FIRM|nr:amidohydrolase [Dysosmobacter acutus]MBU5626459.1 amidohydrolase [Dysosmobacter acutus]
MKEQVFARIDQCRGELVDLADRIFDNPELSMEEHQASTWLADSLERYGFFVERGIAGLETAFRATFESGHGGPSFGLLCEYDALEKQGHACGHHAQGPCILGAAIALKDAAAGRDFKVVVYGTPAEERYSGKNIMIEKGCFKDIDVAFMMHMDGATRVDVKYLANIHYQVIFRGIAAHAGRKPEEGRSALDALILSFNGIEFLREHVIDDVRMHYTVVDAGAPANSVSPRAVGSFILRSYDMEYLEQVAARFRKIMEGAALMTETSVEIIEETRMYNMIPILTLNDLLMENAHLVGAPQIQPPRAKTGSSDFMNVCHILPGACIRMAFVPITVGPHSQGYYDAGKTELCHNSMIQGAKIIAGAICDLLEKPELLDAVKKEFTENQLHKNRQTYTGPYS